MGGCSRAVVWGVHFREASLPWRRYGKANIREIASRMPFCKSGIAMVVSSLRGLAFQHAVGSCRGRSASAFLILVMCLSPTCSANDGGEPAKKNRGPVLRKAEIYQRTLKGTAWVIAEREKSRRTWGTAWVIDEQNCLLVTNDHVVKGAEELKVYFPAYRRSRLMTNQGHYDKKEIPLIGRVVDSYPEKDLAVIRVAALPVGARQLELAAPENDIQPGEDAFSLGNPAGIMESMWIFTSGTVRQVLDAEYSLSNGQTIKARVVESQAPINPGDSGGPVVNDRGEVVAIVDAFDTDASLRTMFIHVSEVRDYMDKVRQWLNPDTADEYLKRGRNYLEKRRFLLALNDFDEAVHIDPTKAEYLEARGEACCEIYGLSDAQDDLSKAAADFSKALSLEPNREKSLALRGWCYLEKGEYKSAEKDFEDALKINDRMGLAYAGRARLRYEGDALESAIEEVTEAIRHNPEDGRFHELRGEWSLELGNWKALVSAVRDFTEAMRLDGQNAELLAKRGCAQVELENTPDADADFKKAIDLDPGNALPFYGRSQLNLQNHAFARALDDINSAIEREPNEAFLHASKGNIFYVQGMTEQANAAYKRAAELDPEVLAKERYSDLQEFNKKELVVANETNETLRVHVQFFTDTDDGKEAWYPSPPGEANNAPPLTFELEPGVRAPPEFVFSESKVFFVRAKKVRLWAEGTTSGRRFDMYKDRDLVVWAGGKYRWHAIQRYLYVFE